jgi:hypothetical protein
MNNKHTLQTPDSEVQPAAHVARAQSLRTDDLARSVCALKARLSSSYLIRICSTGRCYDVPVLKFSS